MKTRILFYLLAFTFSLVACNKQTETVSPQSPWRCELRPTLPGWTPAYCVFVTSGADVATAKRDAISAVSPSYFDASACAEGVSTVTCTNFYTGEVK